MTGARGRTARKRWTFLRAGSRGRGKSILRFTSPAEVKGVALLIVNHPGRASGRWMWRPAIARDQRIALQDRSNRFFSTDFTFEDLEERGVGQCGYRLLAEEAIDGPACWRIESRPRKASSSRYSRSVLWVRQASHAISTSPTCRTSGPPCASR